MHSRAYTHPIVLRPKRSCGCRFVPFYLFDDSFGCCVASVLRGFDGKIMCCGGTVGLEAGLCKMLDVHMPALWVAGRSIHFILYFEFYLIHNNITDDNLSYAILSSNLFAECNR